VNGNGAVLADDSSEVKQKFFTRAPFTGPSTDGYSFFHDVNGSGYILADDFSEVRKRFFTKLASSHAVTAPAAVVRAVPGARELFADSRVLA
jgi:hypothetical protein